jgi:hypothetical protein
VTAGVRFAEKGCLGGVDGILNEPLPISRSLSFRFFLAQQLVCRVSSCLLRICSVSSQWILALLSQDSLADSLAGLARWIRSLLTLDLLGEFSVDSRAALPGFSY